MTAMSGTAPYQFTHRDDLHTMPESTHPAEIDLHGTFAEDADGYLYYGVIGHGLVRISPNLREQTIIPLPRSLRDTNVHSIKYVTIDGQPRLVLTANEAGVVAIVTLSGAVQATFDRPTIAPYDDTSIVYKPTDTVLVGNTLYVADGYGADMICALELRTGNWVSAFGGQNRAEAINGQFGTAHGIQTTLDGQHLMIADRWHSRIQIHAFDGTFVRSHEFPKGDNYEVPKGVWLCGFNTLTWRGRAITVIANLYAPGHERPAPIYIVDAETFDILSIIRPKEDLWIA